MGHFYRIYIHISDQMIFVFLPKYSGITVYTIFTNLQTQPYININVPILSCLHCCRKTHCYLPFLIFYASFIYQFRSSGTQFWQSMPIEEVFSATSTFRRQHFQELSVTAHVERLNKSHFSEIELGTHSYCGYLKVYCPKIWRHSDKNYIWRFFYFHFKICSEKYFGEKTSFKVW